VSPKATTSATPCGPARPSSRPGAALAGGDYAGASNALLSGGDINAGVAVQNLATRRAADARAAEKDQRDTEKAQRDEALKFTGHAAGRLQTSPVGTRMRRTSADKVLQAFDLLAPEWKRHGESDAELAVPWQAPAGNHDLTLAALGAGVKKYQLANGKVTAISRRSIRRAGRSTNCVRHARSRSDGPGEELLPSRPRASGHRPSRRPRLRLEPPTPPPIDPDVLWKSIKAQESGGDPTPGDAVGPDTAHGNALGSTQMLPATAEAMARKLGVRWDPRLMRENSPQALAYQDQLGRAYLQEGLDRSGGDPAEAAAYYYGGPDPKMHGPKTKAYVEQVLARAQGMAQPYQVASAGPTPAPATAPGVEVLASRPHEPEWAPDGQGNLVNRKTGDRKVDPTATADLPDKLRSLTGEALLQELGGEASNVKALAEGRLQFPTGMALSKPYWQRMLQLVGQYDPNFDAANPNSRAATRRDFTSGKSAQNITALNTVIGHLDHLDRTIDGLGNFGSELGPLSRTNNTVAHWIARQSGTDARVRDFETAKSAVANELTRVFRGSGGAEADIQDWQKKLDDTASPQALRTVVRSMATLINSRIQALGEQYNQGMGLSEDPIRLLTPDKQKAFERLRDGSVDEGGGPSASADQLPPQALAALKDGHITTFANGQQWTLSGGKPKRVK
jgi:hypothetical protein